MLLVPHQLHPIPIATMPALTKKRKISLPPAVSPDNGSRRKRQKRSDGEPVPVAAEAATGAAEDSASLKAGEEHVRNAFAELLSMVLVQSEPRAQLMWLVSMLNEALLPYMDV